MAKQISERPEHDDPGAFARSLRAQRAGLAAVRAQRMRGEIPGAAGRAAFMRGIEQRRKRRAIAQRPSYAQQQHDV